MNQIKDKAIIIGWGINDLLHLLRAELLVGSGFRDRSNTPPNPLTTCRTHSRNFPTLRREQTDPCSAPTGRVFVSLMVQC
jgi:hypothetical protein